MLESIDLFPCSIQCAKFLKSKDRIAYCGGQLHNISQLSVARHVNGKACIEASFNFDGNCNKLEICELRSNIVLATVQSKTDGTGSVVLCSARSDHMGYSELHYVGDNVLQMASASDTGGSSGHVTSLAFDEYNTILAHGDDGGHVALNDLNTGSLVQKFRADSSGVVSLSYHTASTLLCSGYSTQHRLTLWDMRASSTPERCGGIQATKEEVGKKDLHFTSFTSHKINEAVVCGNARGDVMLFDLRNTSTCVARSEGVHADAVSCVAFHPLQGQGGPGGGGGHSLQQLGGVAVLSGGCDGRVVETALNGASPQQQENVLLDQSAGITSLDVDLYSSTVLISSSLGSLWKLHCVPEAEGFES